MVDLTTLLGYIVFALGAGILIGIGLVGLSRRFGPPPLPRGPDPLDRERHK